MGKGTVVCNCGVVGWGGMGAGVVGGAGMREDTRLWVRGGAGMRMGAGGGMWWGVGASGQGYCCVRVRCYWLGWDWCSVHLGFGFPQCHWIWPE